MMVPPRVARERDHQRGGALYRVWRLSGCSCRGPHGCQWRGLNSLTVPTFASPTLTREFG